MNYLQIFNQFYETFKQDPLYLVMADTVENSHWHREQNVAVHTDMVVEEYLKRTEHIQWNIDHFKGALVCAFHDVGKPEAKEERVTEERGVHFRFLGHELISTRLMEDYMVRNWTTFGQWLQGDDIYKIGWLIEHHLPYQVKKPDKCRTMKTTVHRVLAYSPEVFEYVLLADQWGRISDNHDVNKQNMNEWLEQYRTWQVYEQVTHEEQPHMIMVIGPSSCGKSTFTSLYQQSHEIFNWDQMRLDKYTFPKSLQVGDVSLKEIYDYAFQQSCDDKDFYSDSLKLFADLVRKKKDIIVDNMNLSDKRRRQFTCMANQHGYFIEMVLLPMSLQQLTHRNIVRGDRGFSEDTMRGMYMRLSYPSINELCHKVTVYNGNLPKQINT